MASSGFEGFEKRLELHFSGDGDPLGLRRLSPSSLDQVLHAVQCAIVSAAGNRSFDAYVLSESSLFVFPNRIIIKTCGTTRLLHSIPLLLHHAAALGLLLTSCRYTRGSFLFPSAQPHPHASFHEEALFLDHHLPESLRHRRAAVLHQSWHVYSASDTPTVISMPVFTIEVCMTDLDRSSALNFFRRAGDKRSGHDAAEDMRLISGIDAIVPDSLICDYAFDPCGYSMNGIRRGRYSTIHVTPEEGYSYASFECSAGGEREIATVLKRVVGVFRPGKISVSVTGGSGPSGGRKRTAVAAALEKVGMSCDSSVAEEFPGVGIVTYQSFMACRN